MTFKETGKLDVEMMNKYHSFIINFIAENGIKASKELFVAICGVFIINSIRNGFDSHELFEEVYWNLVENAKNNGITTRYVKINEPM